jgi:uncharacterized RDD family membrane protein YckC
MLCYAGPLRRLGAMVYDLLLVIAVLMLATAPFVPFLNGQVLMPQEVGALAYVYWTWEIIVIVAFLGFFWTRRGCTLGMQAWRLRIETNEGRLPSWRDALERIAWALAPWLPGFSLIAIAEGGGGYPLMRVGCAGLSLGLLNYCAAYFDPQRRAWHDRRLKTRIVVRS